MANRNLICATLAGALLAAPAAAQYQMMSPMLYEGPRIALQNHANQSSSRPSPSIGRFVAQQVFVPATGRNPASATLVSTRYVPSAERRRANLAQFVEKARSVDPSGAEQMEKLFARTDVIESFGRDLAVYGLRTDNAADAYATWWMQAWQAAHGDTGDVSRTTAQAVKAQATRALSAATEFTSASDATKQEFSEALLVQAALTSASVDTYKSNPAMMRRLGEAVRKGALASGVDLDTMTLTEQGFVPRRKTSAADPARQGKSNSKLALAVAAGSVGLGGAYALGKAMGRKG